MTYKVQIDDQIREATANEIAIIEAQRAHVTALEKAAADKAAALKSAHAKLAELGLTEAEIKALVG